MEEQIILPSVYYRDSRQADDMGKLKIHEIKDLNTFIHKEPPKDFVNANPSAFSENDEMFIAFDEEASDALYSEVAWGRRTYRNQTEQIGLLAGHFCNAAPEGAAPKIWLEVKKIIPCRNPEISKKDYIKISPENWKSMYEELEQINREQEQELVLVGWYHTHPENIPAVFSNIDYETHTSQFTYEYNAAVVLNPHRKTWKAYYGPKCKECQCYIPKKTDRLTCRINDFQSGYSDVRENKAPEIFQYDWYRVEEHPYWSSEVYIQKIQAVCEEKEFKDILCNLSNVLKSNYEILARLDSELKGMLLTGVLLENERGILEMDFDTCHFYHKYQELEDIRENKEKNKLAILCRPENRPLFHNRSWIARFMSRLGVNYLVFCSPNTDVQKGRYGFEIFVKRS